MVFRGKLDIPVIDWRHYLEPFLDMHNSHQSFAARQRLLNYDGDASNQVIWFTAVPAPGAPGVASTRRRRRSSCSTAGWRTSPTIRSGASPGTSRPTQSTRASTWTGRCSRAARDVWDGILDDGPKGQCAAAFPPFATSRIVAGGPIEGGVFKCETQSVDRAIERGLYGVVAPDRGRARAAGADLPDGGLRLHEAGRGSAA